VAARKMGNHTGLLLRLKKLFLADKGWHIFIYSLVRLRSIVPLWRIETMKEEERQKWNEFARELRRRSRWDLDQVEHSLTVALESLPGLEKKEREELLKIGWVVAERSSKLAVAFLRIGPKSLGFVSPGIRPALIRW